MKIFWIKLRHGSYGWYPHGKYFTRVTRKGRWCGFAVRLGKRWYGPLLHERVQRSTAVNTHQD